MACTHGGDPTRRLRFHRSTTTSSIHLYNGTGDVPAERRKKLLHSREGPGLHGRPSALSSRHGLSASLLVDQRQIGTAVAARSETN